MGIQSLLPEHLHFLPHQIPLPLVPLFLLARVTSFDTWLTWPLIGPNGIQWPCFSESCSFPFQCRLFSLEFPWLVGYEFDDLFANILSKSNRTMGGALLGTERFPREKYTRIILDHFKTEYPSSVHIHLPRVLPSKLDFGDIDVLVFVEQSTEGLPLVTINPITDVLFQAKEVVKNGNMTSFIWHEMQVDFIFFPNRCSFEIATTRFDYGDFSMVLGVMLKEFDLKWTSEGLFLKLPPNTPFLMCTDWREAYKVLGLDPDRFTRGFESEDEIASYLSSSILFNPERYQKDDEVEGNRDEKRRANTRKMYAVLKSKLALLERPAKESGGPITKDQFLKVALAAFGKEKEYGDLMEKLDTRKRVKTLFTGKQVERVTGLKDKELGLFCAWIKEQADFEAQIISRGTVEAVDEYISIRFLDYKLAKSANISDE